MTPEQRKSLYMGGLYGGTGVAAAAALIDLLRSHKRKAKAQENKGKDDLVLYLPGYEPKTASEGQFKEAGIGELLLASMLAGGSYYATMAAYKKWRKDQLKSEVRDQSHHYVDVLKQPKEKAALIKLEPGRLAADLMLIGALAGGAGTYGILENIFPRPSEKPPSGNPKRIVVKGFGTVHADDKPNKVMIKKDEARQQQALQAKTEAAEPSVELDQDQREDVELAKAAVWYPFGPADHVKAAALGTVVCAENPEAGGLRDLLGRVIREKSADSVVRDVMDADFFYAIATSKGSDSDYKAASDLEKTKAALQLLSEPRVAPSLAILVQSELHDMHPGIAKMACVVSEDKVTQCLLIKIGSALLEGNLRQHKDLGTAGLGDWLEKDLDDNDSGTPERQQEDVVDGEMMRSNLAGLPPVKDV